MSSPTTRPGSKPSPRPTSIASHANIIEHWLRLRPFLIVIELVIGKLVGDEDGDLAGDPNVVQPAGEALDDPLLGDRELGVGDRSYRSRSRSEPS